MRYIITYIDFNNKPHYWTGYRWSPNHEDSYEYTHEEADAVMSSAPVQGFDPFTREA